jgi:hypothetical protein
MSFWELDDGVGQHRGHCVRVQCRLCGSEWWYLHPMSCWNIHDLAWSSNLRVLWDKRQWSSRIHFIEQLCLQRGVLWLEWRLHCVWRGQVQCGSAERVHGLRGGHVFYSIRGLGNRDVSELSVKLQLAGGERNFGVMYLQRRVVRSRWRHVHPVRGGKVQGVNRTGHVLGLRGGHVFYCSCGHSKLDVSDLSVNLQLACGEWNFGELHLQRRMDRARWRHVCKLCSRKVQDINGTGHVHGLQCRHVLWSSCGHSKLDVSKLSDKFQLADHKQRTDRVHM